MSLSPQQLLPSLQRYPLQQGRYHVAFSGGVDSTVLLHLLSRLQQQGEINVLLSAIHVHHGLQQEADRWADHCQKVCDQLEIPLTLSHVDATPEHGESSEAAARRARYQAFEAALEAGDQLLLAHHQQDQAETFLLRALRGAGPRGLAAMRPMRLIGEALLLRPLLDIPQQALVDYAVAERLDWMEDPSNQRMDADRNYLRHQIIPLLQQRWPGFSTTFSRSSAHCHEADQLLRQWGKEQLRSVDPGEPLSLREGEPEVQLRGRIRSWLQLNQIDLPDTIHLHRVVEEVVGARPDAEPLVEWKTMKGAPVRIRRFQRALYIDPGMEKRTFEQPCRWDFQTSLSLGEGRVLQATVAVDGERVSVARLEGGEVTVGWRRGGERCQPAGIPTRRTLKNLLREKEIPPWEREKIPLLFVDGELAQVVGHFVCEPFVAREGESGILFQEVAALG